MAEIVKFAPPTDNEAVIAGLEAALERARSGAVIDYGAILVVRDGDGDAVEVLWYGERAFPSVLGGADLLKYRMMATATGMEGD